MSNPKARNIEILESFQDYVLTHPEERFWQALRNWSGFAFIYAADFNLWSIEGLRDTFHFRDKNR